jgi:predicted N-acetyltransferase YhbS
MQITPAKKEDIPELVSLVNSAYRGESSKNGWTTEADLLDGIRTDAAGLTAMMEDAGSIILTCRNPENILIGCVYLQKKSTALYLGMLTVAPHLQAKGIGKLLLSAAETQALIWGCSIINMTVISVRNELIAWYQRHGYHKTGETKPFPADPAFGLPKQYLEFVVMEKKLETPL